MTQPPRSHRLRLDDTRQGLREKNRAARAKKARGWARLVQLALCGAVLSAIWQDRALAPPVHDQMRRMAVSASAMLADPHTLQAYLDSETAPSPSAFSDSLPASDR